MTGSQLIGHCICTRCHFYLICYHKTVNAAQKLIYYTDSDVVVFIPVSFNIS